jgi:hypothetical protein
MIESKDEERIGIAEHALVEGQSIAGLIDALKDGHRVPRLRR